MEIRERIRLLRKDYLKLPQPKFAEHISISKGYLASLELGNQPVNERIIKLICHAYGVNERWLQEGSGEIFESTNTNIDKKLINLVNTLEPEFQEYILKQAENLIQAKKQLKTRMDLIEEPTQPYTIEIPYYPSAASAGNGSLLIDDPPKIIDLPATALTRQASMVIRISGDSMEPDYPDGGLVLVKADTEVNIGDVGIFILNNEGY